MSRAWPLLIAYACWSAAGFALFGGDHKQTSDARKCADAVNRIASLAPELTETLFALGLQEQVVGVTIHCNYPPQAQTKPRIGTFWQPNIEAVIGAKPDLVVTLNLAQQKDTADRLARIGYTCLTVNLETVSDLFKAITEIGAATGRSRRAQELVLQIRAELSGLAGIASAEAKPKVLWVVQREPLRIAGQKTFINEIIELAGGRNAIGPAPYMYPPIGTEQLIASGPDVIIETAVGPASLAEQQTKALLFWSKYQNVPAVLNKRIYVIDPDAVSRLGPRLPQGVETVAECLRGGNLQ
jgi:iron complex transport system substrate-binding protein